jgi:hypothetical protein
VLIVCSRTSIPLGNPVRSITWKLRALVLSFMCKYGTSTVVSLLLYTTPVFLKGPRHILYFTLALVLIQFFPGDIPFKTVRSSFWIQLMISLSTSFYKVRKLLYVVSCCCVVGTISSFITRLSDTTTILLFSAHHQFIFKLLFE